MRTSPCLRQDLLTAGRRYTHPPRPAGEERKSATVQTYTRNDALRLLRAINATQSHGRVGAKVWPFVAARVAELEPRTERYDEALWYLLWQGALAAEESAVHVAEDAPFGYSAYALTETAIRMLEGY